MQRGCDSQDEVDYYLQMINEDRDAALLSLIRSLMESGPQLVLQIYILIIRHDTQPQPTIPASPSTLSSNQEDIITGNITLELHYILSLLLFTISSSFGFCFSQL